MRDRVALAKRCANRRGAKEKQSEGPLHGHSRRRAGAEQKQMRSRAEAGQEQGRSKRIFQGGGHCTCP